MLSCVLHKCLCSYPVFLHLSFICCFVLTASLLWTDSVQVCILLHCIDELLVVCIIVSEAMYWHLFSKLLPEICAQVLYLPLRQNIPDDTFLKQSMSNASFSMLLYIFSAAYMLILARMTDLNMLLLDASCLWQLIPYLVCSRLAPNSTPDASVSRYGDFISSLNFMHLLL